MASEIKPARAPWALGLFALLGPFAFRFFSWLAFFAFSPPSLALPASFPAFGLGLGFWPSFSVFLEGFGGFGRLF
jgi:hypothetical protein